MHLEIRSSRQASTRKERFERGGEEREFDGCVEEDSHRRNKMQGVLRGSKDFSVATAKCVRGMVGAGW